MLKLVSTGTSYLPQECDVLRPLFARKFFTILCIRNKVIFGKFIFIRLLKERSTIAVFMWPSVVRYWGTKCIRKFQGFISISTPKLHNRIK